VTLRSMYYIYSLCCFFFCYSFFFFSSDFSSSFFFFFSSYSDMFRHLKMLSPVKLPSPPTPAGSPPP
jgi:hypothetical protein